GNSSDPESIAASAAATAPARRRRRGFLQLTAFLLAAGSAMGGLLATGTLPRIRQEAELHAASAALLTAAPRVRVITPQRAPGATDMVLPGDVTAYQETGIHARTNGYLKRYLVDIGDRVKARQLLAEIETPELDQELLKARATLEQAQAELSLAIAKED